MNAFKRDQSIDGDSLMPQLRATESIYRRAYAQGYDEGYLNGMRAARKLVEDTLNGIVPQAG